MYKKDNEKEFNKRVQIMQDILNELVHANFSPNSETEIVGYHIHLYRRTFLFNSFIIQLKLEIYMPIMLMMGFDIDYYEGSKRYTIGKFYSVEDNKEIFERIYYNDDNKVEYERIPQIILEAIRTEKVTKRLKEINRMNNLVYLLH